MTTDNFEEVKMILISNQSSRKEGNSVKLSDNVARALIKELRCLDDFKARSLSNGAKKIMR